MLVHTTKGLLERDALDMKYAMQFHDNAHVVAVEWYHEGEMVRRDVHVSVLRGPEVQVSEGAIGG